MPLERWLQAPGFGERLSRGILTERSESRVTWKSVAKDRLSGSKKMRAKSSAAQRFWSVSGGPCGRGNAVGGRDV